MTKTASPYHSDPIYPCPFSKGYGIPREQAWLLLKVYFLYRFVLVSVFLVLYATHSGPSILGSHDSRLFLVASAVYWLLTIFSGICTVLRFINYSAQAQTLLFTDIIIITLIMHACGGITSGMGMLLAVSLAAGGLLIGGVCSMLFAALASLSILAEQVYAVQTNAFEQSAFTYTGMLGAAYFTIAFLSYILATRTEQTEQLASRQRQTILKLEELNQYIVQHLQSGIIIFNQQQQISLLNEAAERFLGLSATSETLGDISEQLPLAFAIWQTNPQQNLSGLHLPGNANIYIRFTSLPTRQEILYMLILEDSSVYQQRLQQAKLASLGRLTASIAHEIRNPLGAISHAGQLLAECPALDAQDKRLTEIIQTHTRRVNRIIEDILQLSRRKASKQEKFALRPWVTHYMNDFIHQNDLDETQCRLQFENGAADLYVLMDSGHLKQILDNLCCNALKHGIGHTGKLLLKAGRSNNAPVLDIIDSGPGISPEHREHLFEPFFTTSPTGTGLGLYISRELAELNQATLSYHATDEHGSCFRLCFQDAGRISIEI
jgi:two-component system sensor histidine kinase PilS (NtrC family)